MKAFLLIYVFVSCLSYAEEVPDLCYETATNKILSRVDQNYYDIDDFWSYSCKVKVSKKNYVCIIQASKGDGEAIDTYELILNRTCSHVHRLEIIGEE